ncbi:MAG: DUF5719 family protein [Acidimicrobiales bacterium]
MSDTPRRTVLVGLVVLAVAGGGLADRLVGRAGPLSAGHPPASAVLAAAGADTSAWYCAGSAAAPAGSQPAVVLTNPDPRPVPGTVDVIAPAGVVQHQSFTVPADGQLRVPLAAAGAASVLLYGGGVGALEVVSGPLGWTSAPCVSTTATHWYFAHGSTAAGRSLALAVFNPAATDAVVDISLVSASGGLIEPAAYQGLPVPARSVVIADVAHHVPNDPSLATEVSALSGSVVAAELSTAGAPGSGGLSIVGGVSTPRSQWAFAEDTDVLGGGNVFTVFNPSGRPARVTVSISLAQGKAEPLTMQVPALATASLSAKDQIRIPPNTAYAATFSTGVGPGIVVAREASAPAGAPSATIGFSTASPGGVSRWLVPAVPAPGIGTWALAVVDLAGRPVHVTVGSFDTTGALRPLAGYGRLTLATGGLLVLGPNPPPPVGDAPLEVVGDGPLAVELDPLPSGAPGTVVLPAWALLSPPA